MKEERKEGIFTVVWLENIHRRLVGEYSSSFGWRIFEAPRGPWIWSRYEGILTDVGWRIFEAPRGPCVFASGKEPNADDISIPVFLFVAHLRLLQFPIFSYRRVSLLVHLLVALLFFFFFFFYLFFCQLLSFPSLLSVGGDHWNFFLLPHCDGCSISLFFCFLFWSPICVLCSVLARFF